MQEVRHDYVVLTGLSHTYIKVPECVRHVTTITDSLTSLCDRLSFEPACRAVTLSMAAHIDQSKPSRSPSWKAVAIYYVIACAWSWPFFWRRDISGTSDDPWPLLNLLKHWCLMWGPGLAALVCFVIFRRSHVRSITLLGASWIRSIGMFILPFAVLVIAGSPVLYGYHLRPLQAMVPMFVSILGEELGWRGFLQDTLRPLRPAKRFVLIGVLWEFWHFTTRTTHGWSLKRIAVTLLISYTAIIILSFIIGYAAERTKSLTVAAALHMYVDLILNNLAYGKVLLLVLPVWLIIIVTWPGCRLSPAARSFESHPRPINS